MMIHFHHKGKRVCSMPTAGLTLLQLSVGRKIVAEKFKVGKFSIDVKYSKGDV